MMKPEEKYATDPYYKQMVDFLIDQIMQYNYTPSEMREIAIFACTRVEMMRTNPVMVGIVK